MVIVQKGLYCHEDVFFAANILFFVTRTKFMNEKLQEKKEKYKGMIK